VYACAQQQAPMKQKKVLADNLSPEEAAELGFVIRAVHDLCAGLNVPTPASRLVTTLVEALVRSALVRAKPNRRLAYLSQWRQFLCWLPGVLALVPANKRIETCAKALKQFHLEDRRGQTKPASPFPNGVNCLLEKDGEYWFARVPPEDMPQIAYAELPPAGLKKKFLAGKQIYESEKVTSAIKTERAEYLRPLNPPAVLKKEYEKLKGSLPANDPPDEETVAPIVPDIPVHLLTKWVKDGASRSDLALLIAARRARLTAKVTNLPHLHEAIHWSR
jgi:hypothetical protein